MELSLRWDDEIRQGRIFGDDEGTDCHVVPITNY